MSYELHHFLDQNRLYASQLNEMDEQIAANAQGVATFNVAMVNDRISALRLDTDGSNIILLLGNVEIASVAIADLSAIIQAESFSITSGTSITMNVGDTSQITWSISPSDATQRARFQSQDLSVLTVTSAGVITALGVGIANVVAKCGSLSVNISVTVNKIEHPVWMQGSAFNFDSLGNDLYDVRYGNWGTNRAMCWATSDYSLLLHAGQRIQVVSTGQPFFQYPYALYLTNQTTLDELDYQDFKKVTNVNVVRVAASGITWNSDALNDISGSTKNIDYTATGDCYFVFVVAPGYDVSDASAREAINSRTDMTITISKATT